MTKLTPQDISRLARLLVGSLDFFDLETMVAKATGDGLYDYYVARNQPKMPMIVELLNALERLGETVTRSFLTVVYRERPYRDDLRGAILALYPDIDEIASRPVAAFSHQDSGVALAGFAADSGPGLQHVVRPGLQRLVRPKVVMQDIEIWMARLAGVQRQVCRIDYRGRPSGTGFLVGESAVLTNWHVVALAISEGRTAEIGCRFDFRLRPDGIPGPGQLVALGARGIIDALPCSEGELGDRPETAPPPTAQELDYALLHLAEPMGADRGAVPLAADALSPLPSEPLIIVQHPQTGPMKIAIDTDAVIGLVQDGQRLRYTTNTESGSSGAPCFSMDFQLVALHHYGDPAWGAAQFNQGIPIGLVADSLRSRGHGGWLAAGGAGP